VDGLSLRRQTALAAAVLGGALAAWIVTVQRMRGMDAGPGTDLGALGWFLGIWVTMTAAMMLPSAAPAILLFSSVRRGANTWLFVAGYLLAWTGYGLAAYALYRGIRTAAPSFLAWSDRGPWVAGGALAAAGLYQLTPLKRACLRHCRSPLHFLLHGHPGRFGVMLALFALGVMSLFWMAVVAAAILVEKALPGDEACARLFAVVLVALAILVAASPASVPGLTQPTQMRMEMQR
jgi:predicted metal-binding membrane protein